MSSADAVKSSAALYFCTISSMNFIYYSPDVWLTMFNSIPQSHCLMQQGRDSGLPKSNFQNATGRFVLSIKAIHMPKQIV